MASLLALAVVAPGVNAIAATPALAQEARSYDIPAGPLPDVLNAYARQAGVELAYRADLTAAVASPGLKGRYGLAEGLSRILAGTGVTFRQTGPRAFTLEPAPIADSGAIQLGPVRVEGSPGAVAAAGTPIPPSAAVTERTKSYTTNAVTIGKTVLNPRDIPQSVSVVTRQRIEDQNLVTLTEALQQTPGVTIVSSGTQRDIFTVRGFEVGNILVDGLPTSRQTDVLLSPDLVLYDRVEVLRGANGLLQGTGDPSASVNLVRKRPTDTLAASAAAAIGSWNNYRTEADIGGPLDSTGRLRARIVGSFQDNDYFYDVAHQRKWVVYGVADYAFTAASKVTIGYTYIGSSSTPLVNGVPRYADGGDLHLPRSTYLGADWTRYRFDNQEGFIELQQDLGSDWTAQAALRHSKGSNHYRVSFANGAINRDTKAGGRLFASYLPDYANEQTGADIYATGPVHLLGRDHTLLLGATARQNYGIFSLANLVPGVSGTNIDVFDFDPASVPEIQGTGSYLFHFKSWDKQIGIYGSARLNLSDSLTVTLGSRISWWQASTEYAPDALIVIPKETTRKNGIFTPYAGLVYKLSPAISLYASYADIFQPQTGIQYPGAVLPPVIGSNYEAGLKAGLFEDRLNATIAFFQIDQSNRALPDPAHPCADVDPICYSVPSGKVRSKGFETEITGNLTPNWQVAAGYTYTETEYVKDANAAGNPTANQGAVFNPFTPKHLVKVWTDYTLPGGLSRWAIGGGIQAQSKSYTQSGAVRIEQGGYILANLRVSFKPSERITVAANVNNLFDKRYYSTLDTTAGGNYYGEPRNFMISVRGKL